jgi:hypothetical protein
LSSSAKSTDSRKIAFCVLMVAAAIAAISARDYAGAWNDGSRLATVESLVDYHTFAIDQSIFVQVPQPNSPHQRSPYALDDAGVSSGTGDKLLINGHFYSDKSPVPAVLLAGCYQLLQWCGGLTAREHPDRFCYWMNLLSGGVAYVVATWCVYQLGGQVGLAISTRATLTASFAMATVALPYARHVNNHILLLAVTSALLLNAVKLSHRARICCCQIAHGLLDEEPYRLFSLGALSGLAYTIDLGAGPVLLMSTLAFVVYRCRRAGPVALFTLAAVPWLILHHALNYHVGGTFKPANAVPEYFQWPGCSFNPANMTGAWNHSSVGHFLVYALALLFGKRGFIGHNLALFLALPAAASLLRRRLPELPEVLLACAWSGGTWLAYALTSNNYSGLCCSIRWFVPLLAPGYYVLALFLRRYAQFHWAFLVLSGWGAVMAAIMWWKGPWMQHMVPLFWPLQGAALLTLLLGLVWRQRRQVAGDQVRDIGVDWEGKAA